LQDEDEVVTAIATEEIDIEPYANKQFVSKTCPTNNENIAPNFNIV